MIYEPAERASEIISSTCYSIHGMIIHGCERKSIRKKNYYLHLYGRFSFVSFLLCVGVAFVIGAAAAVLIVVSVISL